MVLDYLTSMLSEGQAANIASTFSKVLSAIVEDPTKTISQLDVLSNRDLESLWNWNKDLPDVIQECFQQYFHRQVVAQPESPAVCALDARFTYHELDELSNKLAHYLVSKGVGPEVVVPLCFEKSAWTVVAMLGVTKSGGAIVFINPSHPVALIDDILSQVNAKLVLASSQHSEMWRGRIDVCEISSDTVRALPYYSNAPNTGVSPSNILYIIFTSGSTGKPKGCVIEHSAYLSGAFAQGRVTSMRPSSRILQFASYSFDVSILEIYTALIFGACVCIPDEQSRSRGIASMLNEFKITWAFLTPSLVKLIGPDDVPYLKTLVLGGEALSKSDVETWADKLQLMNGYGPSECSIASAINPTLSRDTNPANIGHAVGGLLWVVDARDPNKLVPIGAVGELVVEGPILARGYLNNPEKTAAAFMENPAWMSRINSNRRKRIYMTGDLVMMCSDGSINFVGRKDTQVKVRGQRIELGEIEHHVAVDALVRHATVAMPTAGPFKKRLVAVLSFHRTDMSNTQGDLKLVNIKKEKLSGVLSRIREYVTSQVPTYMVPGTWVVVQSLPLTPSGKIDRVKVKSWIERVGEQEYREIGDIDVEEELEAPVVATETSMRLQKVVSHVLNIPLESTALNRSFLNLGGDSISAMQVMTQCKADGMALKIKDILRCKTLSELALCIKSTGQSSYSKDEELDTPFELSPIQQFYFQLEPDGSVAGNPSRYNQSFMLRLKRYTPAYKLTRAIDNVVQRHSMLRARFRRVERGRWIQYVVPATRQSYRFREHQVVSREQVKGLVTGVQAEIDILKGPVLAADLFNEEEGQLLSLVAHHAVVDLVSWRVIMQEIEEFLDLAKMSMTKEKPLPFQTWVKLQAEYARKNLTPKMALPIDIAPSDLKYWGMDRRENKIGDTLRQFFIMDAETTSMILGTVCHHALRTEPIDLFLSALIHSFTLTFTDRGAPTIFREGHGREPWDDEIDISSTVGWFTTMYPVHIKATQDIVETVRRMKDARRSVPRNGWPYFASRYNNPEGIKAFGDQKTAEIQFDYLGLYQQLERDGALLQHEPWDIEDVGQDVQRFSMFEVTAEIFLGRLQFTFEYNRFMKHQDGIGKWVRECENSLRFAVDQLSRLEAVEYTLSDFPLLSMNYDNLDKLVNKTLPKLGLSGLDSIEDAYPTSPMQTGLLLSQAKAAGWYQYYTVFEVQPTTAFQTVDVKRLHNAWQRVVERHASLRTVFVEAFAKEGAFNQIVLKSYGARVSYVKCDHTNLMATLSKQQPIPFQDTQPPHRITICELYTGEVFLKLDINHALVDGSSVPALVKDLAIEYDGRSSPSRAPLYSDYISYLQTWPADIGLEYWRGYLAGVEPCYFPTLDDGVTQEDRLEAVQLKHGLTTDVLNSFCRERSITMSNLFQAAWALVLRSFTGSDQVCFGYLVSGRDVPVDNIENAIGAFINMLVCRLDMSGTLTQVLEKVQEDYANSLPHQHCSLADIQHCIDVDLMGQPLFNSVVNFQNAPIEDTKASISFKLIHQYDPTEYSVALDIGVTGEGLEISLIYRTSTLSNGQAQNVASTVERALKSIMEMSHKEVRVKELDLFSERNYNQVWSWNKNLPSRVEMCIHDVIQRQANMRPNSPAICSWDGDYTYQQLDEISTQLAHYLIKIGVAPEVMVPLCFEKSAWTIVAMLAVMKAGGVFILLDPSHAPDRLMGMVKDLDAKILLTSQQHSNLLVGAVEATIIVNQSSLTRICAPFISNSTRLSSAVKPDNSAYVIFTSGTTGKPKGSLTDHAAFCTSAAAHGKRTHMLPSSRVLQYASYSFDACLMEILTTLMFGGCVCVPSEQSRMDDIVSVINQTGVNWAVLTPSVARLISPSQVHGLQILTLAGEAMSKSDILTWKGAVTLMNGYGPSECCVAATYNTNVEDDPTNIGHSVGGICWIVDPNDHNRLAPVGCIGELLVEGSTLAKRYLNSEEQTADVFISNPTWLVGRRGGRHLRHRLYKTGDLVRYNSNGTMSFLGRKDTQVKFHGQRIELGEIEHRLMVNSIGLEQVAVDVVKPDARQGEQTLVAFLLSHEGTPRENDSNNLVLVLSDKTASELLALQTTLADILPSYMIPSVFIPLKYFPMNASGKLDRKKLRQLAEGLSSEQLNHYSLSSANKRAPTTALEKILQVLWSETLGVAPNSIGADDSFFRIGGDSIGAMRLVAAARSSGILLTVASIFNQPKLCDMANTAELLDGDRQPESGVEPFALFEGDDSVDDLLDDVAAQCDVEKDLIQDVYPCTPLQEGLMALSLKQQGAYLCRNVFRLPTTLDIGRLKQAWETTVKANPILRTRIVNIEMAGSLQIVLDHQISWQTSESLDEYLDEDQRIPILYGGLLSRYGIVGRGVNLYFIWTVHHALYDGWSHSLVFDQVQRVYEAQSIPALVPFSHFISYLSNSDSAACNDFWRAELAGEMPSTFPQLPSATYQPRADKVKDHKVHITRNPGSNIMLSTIIRAAWAIVVARYCDSEDVVFGATMSGRNAPVKDIEYIAGPTITTIPIRVRVDHEQGVADFLEAVQAQAANMIPFEHWGLQNITRLSKNAQFQNLLVIQSAMETKFNFLGAESIPMDEADFNTYALAMECFLTNGKVDLKLRYDGHVLADVQPLLYQFEHVIRQLNDETSKLTLGDIDMCSPEDISQIWKWNAPYPNTVDKCIHSLIEKQAKSRPDAPAICSWDGNFSYYELDKLSTRLSRHLVDLGVEPEVIVPLCFEKSAWTIVAMLAVMKAGGATCVLDPSHPKKRLEDILHTVSAKLLLASPLYSKFCASLIDPVFVVDEHTIEAIGSYDFMPSSTEVSPKNAAYAVFTSGTTGKPKGSVIEHRAFASNAVALAKDFKMFRTSRTLQYSAFSYDPYMLEIMGTLINGGCVCVIQEEARTNPRGLTEAINDMGVNWALLTPSVARLIVPSEVPSLEVLILGGEGMTRSDKSWSKTLTLVNGYGPSECSVASVLNPNVTTDSDHTNIGRGVGSLTWIVDPHNHNRLAPVGCIGELLLEGPALSRGYINEKKKTADVFIENPTWLQGIRTGGRLYKTGDLVRYNPDGTISFIGRKDMQVKLHGQRLELSEIEHHLSAHSLVENAAVLLPNSGHCKGRLVAILSLKALASSKKGDVDIQLVNRAGRDAVAPQLSEIRSYLENQLPAYMIPNIWAIVDSVPLSTSLKLNKRKMATWLESMPEETYLEIMDLAAQNESTGPSTPMEKQLQEVLSRVLNLSMETVSMNRSFLSLGGDSITAMQVMARCRAEGITVKIKDILQSKTISQLALCAKEAVHVVENSKDDAFDTPFSLSPIQQMYFEATMGGTRDERLRGGSFHFNQSILLRLRNATKIDVLDTAMRAVVRQHSMLRARFSEANGTWRQQVLEGVSGSYHFGTHTFRDQKEIASVIAESQSSLDPENGPVFAAHFFQNDSGDQLLFMVASHLVIDVVSWRVLLQDLEEFLESGKLFFKKPLPFQTWCRLQAEYASSVLDPKGTLPFTVAPANYEYWGLGNRANLYGDALEDSFTLDQVTTSALLGTCHQAFRTEPVDILLSALLLSFGQIFIDRDTPPVFCEGHGREPWDTDIDLSGTVGWFTTIYPIQIAIEDSDNIIDTLRRVKDTRRQIKGNGWPYFASRFLNDSGTKVFEDHCPMEMMFNYLGLYQQLERNDGLLQQMSLQEVGGSVNGPTSDVGLHVRRLALFEISAEVLNGTARFTFTYNRHIHYQSSIRRWILAYKEILMEATQLLTKMETQHTLSDFPLLSITYDGLEKIKNEHLPKLGLSSLHEVEDIYPCSAMQQGVLISQTRSPENYKSNAIFEVSSVTNEPIEVLRLQTAWQKVVARHASLRTVFIESMSKEGLYDQVVLKEFVPRVLRIECDNDDVLTALSRLLPVKYDEPEPPHRVVIVKTEGQIYMKLEISHALTDGGSLAILLQDLQLAYDGKLSLSGRKPPLYSDYISYVQSQPKEEAIKYWTEYLAGVEPCYFPALSNGLCQEVESIQVELDVPSEALFAFCQEHSLTASNLFQIAWALVLRSFTGLDQVCFGYLTSGRDAPVEGIQEAVGAICNMMVCRLDVNRNSSIKQLLENTQESWTSGLQYQNASLAEIQHHIGLSGQSLFNTGMSFQGESRQDPDSSATLSFEAIHAHDPSEYDITVNIKVLNKQFNTTLSYRPSIMTGTQAENVASTLSKALQSLLETPEGTVNDLNLISERNRKQIFNSNTAVLDPAIADSCVHDIIDRRAEMRPDAPAVCSWDGNLSYKELNALSNRLSKYLISLGVRPEVLVPVCFEKSKWAIVSILAIIKAGGAFVPMDAAQTGRFETIVRKTGAKIVLTSAKCAQSFSKLAEIVLPVDEDMLDQLDSSDHVSHTRCASNNALYVLFTSGSTGEPKGCVIEHSAYCSSALSQKQAWGTNSSSRVLQFASYSFDASMGEIITTLMVGGCVCIPSDAERLDDVAAAIRKMRINFVIFPPSLAKLLNPEDVPAVKVMVLGGESTAKEDILKWHDKIKLIPAYGPTECSLVSSSVMNLTAETESSNIGVPNAANYWIVDFSDHNKLVPVGAIGELLIEGLILARGYLNNPAQTETSFIENPDWIRDVSPDMTRRMYKTGDLVQYNADGSFRYMGRKDSQVKLRGQRIELGEVEYHLRRALGKSSDVAAEVLRFDNGNRDAVLAAFISLGDDFDGDENLANISTLTKERLSVVVTGIESLISESAPLYMIPSVFIPVKTLPLSPSLKIDRRKLRSMASALSKDQLAALSVVNGTRQSYLTETEKRMQALWASVLNIDASKIHPDDSFIKLGGDSIIAIKLVAACRAEGLTLSVADVLRNLTLASMCQSLSTVGVVRRVHEPMSALGPLAKDQFLEEVVCPQVLADKVDIEDVVEATSMQASFLTTGLLKCRGNTNYFTFNLSGSIDSIKLENACQMLVSKHRILRTAFIAHQRQVWQVILRHSSPEFRRYHCARWRLTHLAAKLAKMDQAEPVSLGDPIVRFMFLDGGKQSLLIMRISHAQYDGMSIPVLVTDLADLYEGKDLPERPIFSEFVHSARENNVMGAEEYWYSLLKGSTMTNLVSHKTPPYENSKLKTITRHVPSTSPQAYGMTFATIMKAAWALVLARLSGSTDVVFGHLISGRNLAFGGGDINEVLGPCLNIIPVRVQFQYSMSTVSDLLQQVHDQQLAAIPFETFGFDKIVERCTEWPLWTRFSSVVQHQNLDGVEDLLEAFRFGEAECKFGAFAPSHDSVDVLVLSSPKGSKTKIDLHFSENLIPSQFAEDMMDLLCQNIQLLSDGTHNMLPPTSTWTSSQPQIPLLAKQLKEPQVQLNAENMAALNVLSARRNGRGDQFRQADTPWQTTVERAWNHILRTDDEPMIPNEEVTSHTSFFNVWGSLLAAAQFSEFYARHGLDITMEEIIDNPTIHLQCLLIMQKMGLRVSTAAKRPWYQKELSKSRSWESKSRQLWYGYDALRGQGQVHSQVASQKPTRFANWAMSLPIRFA